jgi:hypothetical protein
MIINTTIYNKNIYLYVLNIYIKKEIKINWYKFE